MSRERALRARGVSLGRVDAERTAFSRRADEVWGARERVIRRSGERKAVAGFDLTFSPPKSVSVLWAAAPPAARERIWAAQREGVAAAMGFVEREAAWLLTGHDGVRQVDTTGLIHAAFDHRMSRSGDVQIHTHVAVANRVRCDDGARRALDGRAVYRVAAAAGAIYDQVREAALERDLGVSHEVRRPGQPREVAGVPDEVCALFSTRRTQILDRVAQVIDSWEQAHPGDTPSAWTIAKLSQWVTLETRQAKPETGESTSDALARWEAQTRAELGVTLAEVWARATGTRRSTGADAATVSRCTPSTAPPATPPPPVWRRSKLCSPPPGTTPPPGSRPESSKRRSRATAWVTTRPLRRGRSCPRAPGCRRSSVRPGPARPPPWPRSPERGQPPEGRCWACRSPRTPCGSSRPSQGYPG